MILKTDGSLEIKWNMFENTATCIYARSISEKNKKRSASCLDENFLEKTIILKYVSIVNFVRNILLFLN
jgi:hypothetical protein